MPPDTYGLLRTLCSRNPKNIRNPPYSGFFLMFYGSQSHAFSCKHETHDLLTLVSYHKERVKFQKRVSILGKFYYTSVATWGEL